MTLPARDNPGGVGEELKINPNDDEAKWGKATSVWLDTTPPTDYAALADGPEVDVAVAGGGIAGLVSAYFLAREGLRVAVVEANYIIADVTGYTTGKITSQHGLLYGHLAETLGEDQAAAYGAVNQAALEQTVAIIQQLGIDCDFKRADSYLFTEQEENLELIRAEAETAQRLGLPAAYVDETPMPFARGAVRFEGQAQFHPRKYLLALAAQLVSGGGYIFEKTMALEVEGGKEEVILKTDRGKIKASALVVATNTPFYQRELFVPRLTPQRSYVLGVRLAGEVPEGLHYGIDGTGHSLRNQPVEGGKILMVGSWEKALPLYAMEAQYARIETFARASFDIASIDYHWFTQDLKTPDRRPYIGRMPGASRIYMVAGFGGWGMTNSAVAGMTLAGLVTERDDPWAQLFDPGRISRD